MLAGAAWLVKARRAWRARWDLPDRLGRQDRALVGHGTESFCRPGEALANALTALPAFKAFTAGIQDRCDVLPHRVDLTEIGAYGFFGA